MAPKGKGGKKVQEEVELEEVEDEEVDVAQLMKDRLAAAIARQNPNFAEDFVLQLQSEVQTRVRALQGMQSQINAILEEHKKESQALTKKFDALNEPNYIRRARIVNGDEEVDVAFAVEHLEEDKAEVEKELKESQAKATAEEKALKGVPGFWSKVLHNHMLVEDMCQERDAPALEFLKDIQLKRPEEGEGFSLEFHFGENPYFTNTVLTKSYHLIEHDADIMLERAQGCEIDWKGENLTVVEKKKKQRHKAGKGTRTVTVSEPCDSFFNFFKPPQANEEEEDEENDDEIENLIEADYELGQVFRDQIVPKAIDWFTGKARATQEAEFEFNGDSDEEEEDEEEEEEEEQPRGRGRGGYGAGGRGGRGGAPGGRGGAGGRGGRGGQEECKQQ